ncbi:MAG: hypothetical protein JWL72_3317, partial [Ilumatobacteraceae bacterium]|nr:hypothetical protein [Ilumatobacteraceae bacterium]
SAVVPPGQPKTIKGTLHKGISGYEDDIIYQTGTDPDPAAEETGVELITATGVIFQESDAIDKIVQTLIHKAIAKATSILNSLPGHPDVSSVVEFLTSSGNSVIPAALAPEGAVDIEPITVPVTYHLAKPPDPTTPPTAAPTTSTTIQTDDGASCTLIPLTIVPTDFLTQLNLGNINLTLQDNGTAVLDWNGSTTLTDPSGDNIQIRGTQTTTWTRDGGANYTFGVLSGDLEAYLQIAGTGDYQDIGPINTSGLGAASEELAGLLVGTASCSNFTLTFAPAEGAPTGVQFHYAYQVTPGPAPTTTVAPGG